MKKRNFLTFLFLVPAIASCAGREMATPDSDEYVTTINAGSDDFVILQLADIHWTYNTLIGPAKKYLNKVDSSTSAANPWKFLHR